MKSIKIASDPSETGILKMVREGSHIKLKLDEMYLLDFYVSDSGVLCMARYGCSRDDVRKNSDGYIAVSDEVNRR